MYEDFKVKASEKDCIVIVRFPMVDNFVTFVTWDGLQFMIGPPEKEVKFYQPITPAQGRTVFTYCQQHIPGVKEVVEVEELNPYEMAIYQTEVSEAYTRYENHIKSLWERVSISDVLDYIDRIGEYADFYNGVAEQGYDDKPMICANWNPPKMKRLGDWIEKFYHGNIEVDWSDEWMSCSDCGKAIREQADSYGWEPSWVWVSDCEIICRDCVHEYMDEVIEQYANQTNKAVPSWIQEQVEKLGFKCLETDDDYCARFETGFHRGQDDTPEKAIKLAKEILPYKFDYLFMITSRGQFDINWTILIRKQEVEEEV